MTGGVHAGFWCVHLREGDNLEQRGVNGIIILKWILEKWNEGHGLDRSGSGQGQVASCCECGNELSGVIKCGVFLAC